MMEIRIIFISILLITADGFTVRGPSAPLVAPLGSSVVLPCYITDLSLMEDLEVEWRRTDSETLVHLYQDGESQTEVQQQDYHDRAHFFTEEIQHGNFSLCLDDLRAEDEGRYTCKVYSSQDSGETVVQIKYIECLQISGSKMSVSAYDGEDVTLNCSVNSHITAEHIEEVLWLKKDEDGDIMVLLFQNNGTFSNSSDERYRDRVEFFTDEIPNGNFSLKLKRVRTEDKGVYMCLVFAGGASANATVELKILGFSSLHMAVLGFCVSAGSGAVLLLCFLIFCRSTNTVTSSTIWSLQFSLVICPNICMLFAFILWGFTDGFLHESITCSAFNILRPLMLIWASPCLKYLQDNLKTWTRFFKITIKIFIFTVIVYSVLFTYVWRKTADDTDTCHIIFGLYFGMVLLWSFFLNKVWIKLCWITITLDIISDIYIHVTTLKEEDEVSLTEYLGWTCFIVFNGLLKMVFTKYVLEGPGVWRQTEISHGLHLCHEIMLMFGAVGLVLLSSVTLTAELILKARNGERVMKDLRVIVFPSECVFAFYWLVLQTHAYLKTVSPGVTQSQRNSSQRSDLGRTLGNHEMARLSEDDSAVSQTL